MEQGRSEAGLVKLGVDQAFSPPGATLPKTPSVVAIVSSDSYGHFSMAPNLTSCDTAI